MVLPWTESLKKKISYSGHPFFYCLKDDDQENLAESKKPKRKTCMRYQQHVQMLSTLVASCQSAAGCGVRCETRMTCGATNDSKEVTIFARLIHS